MTSQCSAIGRDGNRCAYKHESGYCHKHSFYRSLTNEDKSKITKCSNCKMFSFFENKCLSCGSEQCSATIRDGNRCSSFHETGYCNRHSYFRSLTKEDKLQITRCSHCKLFTYLINKCLSCNNEQCYAIMKNDERCAFTSNLANKQTNEKTFYCNTHSEWDHFEIDNSNGFNKQDILTHVVKCVHCKKYFKKGNGLTCENCQNYAKRPKLPKANIVKCEYNGCNNKAKQNGETFYELFCGKHTGEAWKMTCQSQQKKECANYIRGCREMIDLNQKQKCKKCLKKDRMNDKKRRHGGDFCVESDDEQQEELTVKNVLCPKINIEHNETFVNKTVENKQILSIDTLSAKHNETPENQMVENGQKLKMVTISDEPIIIPQICKGINNKRKQCQFRVEPNQEYCKYHLDQATLEERRMKLCTNCNKEMPVINPRRSCDKCLEDGRNKDRGRVLHSERFAYKAASRNKECNLTTKEIMITSFSPCHYCGNQFVGSELNGIDRINNQIGYTKENITPCCRTCNVIKYTNSDDVFLKMVQHIATYHDLVDNGELHSEVFQDHYGDISIKKLYDIYQDRAAKRNKIFSLSLDEFAEIQKDECYLCGKQNTDLHKNGLDRVDNNLGFVEENVSACCGNCNMAKSTFDISEFLEKCQQITNYQKSDKQISHEHLHEIVDEVSAKLQTEHENKLMNYKCWANKVPSLICDAKIRVKHYCHIHKYLAKYSVETLQQLQNCNECFEFGVIDNYTCNECGAKRCDVLNCQYRCKSPFNICFVHRNEGYLCQANSYGSGKCYVKCSKNNNKYCTLHLYWSNYTAVEQQQFISCDKCLDYHLPNQCISK